MDLWFVCAAPSSGRNLIFGGLSSVIASPPPPSPPPSPPPAPFAPGTGFSPPPPGFVIKSDPHFQGLDGNVFDFDGEAGNVYTLLLQPDDGLELIARFSTAYTTGIDMVDGVMFAYKPKGTWLTSVAVRVTADDAEEILVVATSPLGGAATQTRHGSVLQYAGDGEGADLIQVEFAEHGQTDIISFISENLEGKITVVPPPANWEVEEENKAGLTHLNIGIDRLSTSNVETLDGVLGISATGRHPEGRVWIRSLEITTLRPAPALNGRQGVHWHPTLRKITQKLTQAVDCYVYCVPFHCSSPAIAASSGT
eukprot:scaffold624_cov402-Prasinococcus_capsulatus_cf.AAC.55